jgi:hypothetical protein
VASVSNLRRARRPFSCLLHRLKISCLKLYFCIVTDSAPVELNRFTFSLLLKVWWRGIFSLLYTFAKSLMLGFFVSLTNLMSVSEFHLVFSCLLFTVALLCLSTPLQLSYSHTPFKKKFQCAGYL